MSDHESQKEETQVAVVPQELKKKAKPVYVTVDILQEKLNGVVGFMEEIAKNAESNNKRAEAELQTITNMSTRLDALEQTTVKLVTFLQGQQDQQQQQQPQAQQQQGHKQSISLPELATSLKDLASAGREIKDAYEGNQTGVLDKLAVLVRNRYEKQVATAAQKDIRKWLRAGEIDPSEVVGLMDTDAGPHSHEPVL